MDSSKNIITVNAGSSSIKVVVFAIDHQAVHAPSIAPRFTLTISGIGQSVSTVQTTEHPASMHVEKVDASDYLTASQLLMERLGTIIAPNSVVAIGHRLVHGGAKYDQPVRADDIPAADWDLLSQLDPQHTPAARQLIGQFAQFYPSAIQVACFDTAFFHDLPPVAKIIPIPQKYYDLGIRRYGFHGLSYTSLLSTFQEKAGKTAANGRVIMAHLGSGASVTATHKGKPVDTTMGFTPASGIVMSTRSGDLDPTISGFLHRQYGVNTDEFDHMVNFESGLLGVSGLSGDMESLLAQETHNKAAARAIELFVRDVKKTIGALATILGGVDSLLFSGGIGEKSSVLRTRICQGLEYMGIAIDETANNKHNFLISSQQSRAGVHVLSSDEAQVIAMQTHTLLTHRTKESLS